MINIHINILHNQQNVYNIVEINTNMFKITVVLKIVEKIMIYKINNVF